jgi:hypothetical protein
MAERGARSTERGRTRTLAETYRRFAESDARGTSPLYERVALAVAGSDAALRAVRTLPARKRHPNLVLACLHDLALAGHAPALAAAYDAADADAAAVAAVDTLLGQTGAVAATATRRTVRTDETDRCAVLHPALVEAASRAGTGVVGLVDVGTSAGFNLLVDRVAIRYSNGRSRGDPSSPVRLSCRVVGDRPLPAGTVPEVVARVGVGIDPLDVADAADARWLRACVWPDRRERLATLDAELALARTVRPVLLSGDVLDLLPDALAKVPSGALPVVVTTWALSRLRVEDRRRFLRRLQEASTGRPVAWVSLEGVGVAPTVPTLGDRPASGHSIIGLATCDGAAVRTEAVGRCWSRGRLVSWLVDP